MKNLERQLKIFKLTTLILLILLIGVLVLTYFYLPKYLLSLSSKQTSANLTEKAKPKATAKIEKTFEYPIQKLSQDNFKLKIIKAEGVEMVATKGEPVTAKENEGFLLLYLEIENNQKTAFIFDSQNYFRLIAEGDKKLAPDFYNGEIEIPAISTKKDQIGFVVSKSQKEFKLQVGEIEGEKEIFNFKF